MDIEYPDRLRNKILIGCVSMVSSELHSPDFKFTRKMQQNITSVRYGVNYWLEVVHISPLDCTTFISMRSHLYKAGFSLT